MSKYVKNLVAEHIAQKLQGVDDALVVDVIGLDANTTCDLRNELAQSDISLMVIKNSLVKRATEGSAIAPAFEGLVGTAAVVWGGEDLVSLAKCVVGLSEKKVYEGFEARGGVMDGEAMTSARVKEVSKWPSRQEQLSLLIGQILGPGAELSAQLLGPGSKLAGQIEEKSKEDEAGE